jgi:hypothetical protein
MESGFRSAEAIAGYFEGDSTGMVEYERWMIESFRSYLETRHRFYSSVERWPGSPFWERRATPLPHGRGSEGSRQQAGFHESNLGLLAES